MADKKELIFPHVKAPNFVSVSAAGSALSRQNDGTYQLTFYAMVTELGTETLTLEPIDDKGEDHKVMSTAFDTNAVKEDRVRVVMSEQHMRELSKIIAQRLGDPGDKSKSGNGTGND